MIMMVFELLRLMFATNSFYFFVEVNVQRLTIVRHPFGLMFIPSLSLTAFYFPSVLRLLDSDDDDYYSLFVVGSCVHTMENLRCALQSVLIK